MEEQYDEIMEELLAHQKNKPVKPKMPILIFEDCTSEALLAGLSEDIPNATQASSEGGVLLNSRGMSKTSAHNTLWSGDDINVSTKSGGSITVTEARFSMNIMVQPSALTRFMKKTKDDVRGNGFLSRFLVCAPPSNCGGRYANGVKHSSDGIQAFNDKVYQLLSEAAELDDYTDRKVVRFSSEAKNIWFDHYNNLEHEMGSAGIYRNTRDHASKNPENTARLAALIHCFDNPTDENISAETLLEAVNLMGYFSSQFMKVFSAPPKYLIDSQNLMQWFSLYVKSGVRYIKRNKILQYGPSGTRNKKDLDAAIGYLKSDSPQMEFTAKKIRVVDLWPNYPFDEAKLKHDLSLDITF